MTNVGSFALDAGSLFLAYGILASVVGLVRWDRRFLASARGAGLAVALALAVASLWLWHLLLVSDFRYAYVVQETNLTLPLLYKVAAFWSGFSGSLLLWSLLLALYMGYHLVFPRPEARPLLPVVTLVFFVVVGFFLFLLDTQANPFAPAPPGIVDGQGLNPLLQYPEMAIHPVLLYAGFTGMTVPFAFAMATLWRGKPGQEWLWLTRRTTLVAWLFLTAGIVLGAHWSYRVLGWGGYWAWDPVENASFLPWLTATAFLHSAIVEERRGSMRGWNVILVLVTFLLTLFGTFLTRSGIVTSIHAFTNTSVWPYFLFFLGSMTLASCSMLAVRWRTLGDRPVSGSWLSKETSFVFNNVLLLGATLAILWGTLYPLVSEAVLGATITAGTSYFNTVFAPIALALVLFMGICPELPWQEGELPALLRGLAPSGLVGLVVAGGVLGLSKEVPASVAIGVTAFSFATMVRAYGLAIRRRRAAFPGEGWLPALFQAVAVNRRRYGGYLVHIGILILTLGIIGTQVFQVSRTVTLRPGSEVSVGAASIRLEGLGNRFLGPYPSRYAVLSVRAPGGSATLQPSLIDYPFQNTPTGRPAIWSTPWADVYTVLSGTSGQEATFLLIVNPLVSWIWFGALVTVIGVFVALGHGRRQEALEAEARLAAL